MKYLLFILYAILIISCTTPRQTKTNKSFNEISFGNSGGFTGYSDEYLIKGNGEVFKIAKGETIKINQISRIEVQKLSNRINEIRFQDLSLTDKGNLTYYLMVTTNKYSNKVTWSDETASPEIKNIYQILVRTLKPK